MALGYGNDRDRHALAIEHNHRQNTIENNASDNTVGFHIFWKKQKQTTRVVIRVATFLVKASFIGTSM